MRRYCLFRSNNLTGSLGIQNLNDFKEINRVVFTSDKFYIHPEWNETTRRGDIALVRLPYDIPFSSIQII